MIRRKGLDGPFSFLYYVSPLGDSGNESDP